jgi:hypothetical protein
MVTATPHEDVEAAYGQPPDMVDSIIGSVLDYGRACADELPDSQQMWLDDIRERLEGLQHEAYADGRNDEAEEQTATALIDAWVQTHGKPIPWGTAVEIISIVNKLPDAERVRLLALGEAG